MYRYELHMHTSDGSICGRKTTEEMLDFYKKAGFQGVFLTEHFLNGNTNIPKDLPWNEKAEKFCSVFQNAKKYGEKIGIDVFFGWEYSYQSMDLVTIGLSEKWLLNHPECIEVSPKEYCDMVHGAGGFLIHAHPFKERTSKMEIDIMHFMPKSVDAIEVVNGNMNDFVDAMANHFAESYSLIKLGGTDNHRGVHKKVVSVSLEKRVNSAEEFIETVKKGEYKLEVINGEEI